MQNHINYHVIAVAYKTFTGETCMFSETAANYCLRMIVGRLCPEHASWQQTYHHESKKCRSNTGWWFEPLWEALVKWDNYCQQMEKYEMFQTTNQKYSLATVGWRGFWLAPVWTLTTTITNFEYILWEAYPCDLCQDECNSNHQKIYGFGIFQVQGAIVRWTARPGAAPIPRFEPQRAAKYAKYPLVMSIFYGKWPLK